MRYASFQSVALSALAIRIASGEAATPDPIPCTAHSIGSGAFYDLRPLSKIISDPAKPSANDPKESWHSRGYDFNANFTLNICAPVVEELKDVVGIGKSEWKNISAYYEKDGKTYSIGEAASTVSFRGRKLILQYTNGSPCGPEPSSTSVPQLRKSALISFHCDADPPSTPPSPSFVGWDPSECSYMFEMRSKHACGGAVPVTPGAVGPAGVFGIIAIIAVLVYFVGGIMYQRSVAHARGWRQLPNYSMWAGIYGFFEDFIIIIGASLSRFLPSRRGYQSLSISADDTDVGADGARGRHGGGALGGRVGGPDDENRLIDQLDEEWDD